jgi:hypothetical protein
VHVAKHCDILEVSRQNFQTTYKIEVPLLWTGEKCINGDLPIIQYLQKQSLVNHIGMKKS